VAARSAARLCHYSFSTELATRRYRAASSTRFLPMGAAGARNSPRGSSAGGELRNRVHDGEAGASTFDDSGGELHGIAHDEVRQNG
jgi:hypothetical protein